MLVRGQMSKKEDGLRGVCAVGSFGVERRGSANIGNLQCSTTITYTDILNR